MTKSKDLSAAMNVAEFLSQATYELQQAGIQTARLDCLIMLEDVLDMPRANLLAHPEMPLLAPTHMTLNNFITQRKQHVPLAYIRGRTAFYGRDFLVNEHVLVPRPETESMVELLRNISFSAEPRLLDVGCGTGCIGITAALEFPQARVTLSDISKPALQVARRNATRLQAPVEIQQRDLLQALPNNQYDVLLANLPYVPDGYVINQAATHEPALALFAGPDGLDAYRRLFNQASLLCKPPFHIITEALPSQHTALATIATAVGYALETSDGLAQDFVYTR